MQLRQNIYKATIITLYSSTVGCLPFSATYFLANLLASVSSLTCAYLLYMLFQVHNKICLPCTAICFLHLFLFLVLTLRWSNRPANVSLKKIPSAKKETEYLDEGKTNKLEGKKKATMGKDSKRKRR